MEGNSLRQKLPPILYSPTTMSEFMRFTGERGFYGSPFCSFYDNQTVALRKAAKDLDSDAAVLICDTSSLDSKMGPFIPHPSHKQTENFCIAGFSVGSFILYRLDRTEGSSLREDFHKWAKDIDYLSGIVTTIDHFDRNAYTFRALTD